MLRLRSCASSMISVSYRSSSRSRCISVSRIPSVITLISVSSLAVSANLTLYPTHAAELGLQLRRDPLGDGAAPRSAAAGCARSGRVIAAAELQADLGQLRRLARAGLPGDDHDLVVPDGRGELSLALADRQLGRIGDDRDAGPPRLHALLGRCHLAASAATARSRSPGSRMRSSPVGTPGQPTLVAQHQPRQACPQLGERGRSWQFLQIGRLAARPASLPDVTAGQPFRMA